MAVDDVVIKTIACNAIRVIIAWIH